MEDRMFAIMGMILVFGAFMCFVVGPCFALARDLGLV